ncbi:uncharacterized protein LOC116255271 [Nymphaea colorata]|nr:uncharacterized protein LOC116255271 [Nymphaea colorata]
MPIKIVYLVHMLLPVRPIRSQDEGAILCNSPLRREDGGVNPSCPFVATFGAGFDKRREDGGVGRVGIRVSGRILLSYINELIEYILLTKKDDRELDAGKPSHVASQNEQTAMASAHCKDKRDPGELVASANQGDLANLVRIDGSAEASSSMASHVKLISSQTESVHHLPSRTAEWARGFEAARERRTEVLAPENLENLWTKGRNYKAKIDAHDNPGPREAKPPIKAAGSSNVTGHERNLEREMGKEGSLNVKSSKPQLKRSKSSSFITKNDVGICEASTS